MKMSIRRGVFETNSSSTHSITMVSGEDYQKWENGELLFDSDSKVFLTREEAIKVLKDNDYFMKNHKDFDFTDEEETDEMLKEYIYCYTYSAYWDYKCEYYETYTDTYTAKNGEEIVAFGYYGTDN